MASGRSLLVIAVLATLVLTAHGLDLRKKKTHTNKMKQHKISMQAASDTQNTCPNSRAVYADRMLALCKAQAPADAAVTYGSASTCTSGSNLENGDCTKLVQVGGSYWNQYTTPVIVNCGYCATAEQLWAPNEATCWTTACPSLSRLSSDKTNCLHDLCPSSSQGTPVFNATGQTCSVAATCGTIMYGSTSYTLSLTSPLSPDPRRPCAMNRICKLRNSDRSCAEWTCPLGSSMQGTMCIRGLPAIPCPSSYRYSEVTRRCVTAPLTCRAEFSITDPTKPTLCVKPVTCPAGTTFSATLDRCIGEPATIKIPFTCSPGCTVSGDSCVVA